MIQRDPAERLTAQEYLKVYKGPYIESLTYVLTLSTVLLFYRGRFSRLLLLVFARLLQAVQHHNAADPRQMHSEVRTWHGYNIHFLNGSISNIICVNCTRLGSTEMLNLFWQTCCWTREIKIEKQATEVCRCLGYSERPGFIAWLYAYNMYVKLNFLPIDALVIILSAITSHLRLTQVRNKMLLWELFLLFNFSVCFVEASSTGNDEENIASHLRRVYSGASGPISSE